MLKDPLLNKENIGISSVNLDLESQSQQNHQFFLQITTIFPFVKPNFVFLDIFANFRLFSITFLITFLDISLFLLLLFHFSPNYYEIPTNTLIKYGAKVPLLVKNGEIWRLFTANFLHLNFFHLFSNITIQIVFGPMVEKLLKSRNFFILYVFSGIGGFLLSTNYSNFISVGASGALFGVQSVYPAFYMVNYKEIVIFRRAKLSILMFIVVFFGFNLIFAIIYREIIDHWNHFGGVFTGFFFGILMIKPCIYSSFVRKLKIFAFFALFIGFFFEMTSFFFY